MFFLQVCFKPCLYWLYEPTFCAYTIRVWILFSKCEKKNKEKNASVCLILSIYMRFLCWLKFGYIKQMWMENLNLFQIVIHSQFEITFLEICIQSDCYHQIFGNFSFMQLSHTHKKVNTLDVVHRKCVK